MSDLSSVGRKRGTLLTVDARTKRRNAAEARFKIYGLIATCVGMVALVVLLTSILGNGLSAFQQTTMTLAVDLPEEKLDKSGTRDLEVMKKVTTIGYAPLLRDALLRAMAENGITIEGLSDKQAGAIISKEAPATLRNLVLANPGLVGQTVMLDVLANGRIDGYFKGRVSQETALLDGNVTPEQLQLADALKDADLMRTKFNWDFITLQTLRIACTIDFFMMSQGN